MGCCESWECCEEKTYIGYCRGTFETCTNPVCHAYRLARCEPDWTEELDEDNPLGSREELLRGLAVCARLCYGAGFISREDWGKADPPLNGEGWVVIEQILENLNSDNHVQAACYTRPNLGIGIVAIRGTVSYRGVLQDIAVGLPVMRRAIRSAIREACGFFMKCEIKFPKLQLYITGHSLGGFIAQAAATYMEAEGAVFNCPGPVAVTPGKSLVGPYRPNFEVHLTRNDPLAFSFFPKPENFHHIAWPQWHPGSNHKICEPYMMAIEDMRDVHPNNLPLDTRSAVDQAESLELELPADIRHSLSDSESETSESDSELGHCYLCWRGFKTTVCG